MGYWMYLLRADVFIPRQAQDQALRAVRELAQSPHGAAPSAFAWVDMPGLEAATTLPDALAAWRWIVLDEDDEGNITELDFTGEKLGDEDTLFRTLAPYVREG